MTTPDYIKTEQQEVAYLEYENEDKDTCTLDFETYYMHWCSERGYSSDNLKIS